MGRSEAGHLRFRVSDKLSGIASYRVEVNGYWCLFSYDPKFRLLEGSLQEPVFRKGTNRIVVRLEDCVGNVATLEKMVVL